jgi:glycosyltransferase involved in cell wall biosynthesis
MKVLMLAPHPYFQDRGTPIDVDVMLRVLSEAGHEVDLVTYHEGRDVSYPGLRIHRIPRLSLLSGVRPGFSWKKVLCDLLMIPLALRLAMRKRYDLVHAGEEAVFIARGLRTVLGLPYVYDMDSSVAQQMIEKYGWLAPLNPFLRAMERLAVRGAAAIVPVCQAIADSVACYGPRYVMVLPDVSQLSGDPRLREDQVAELGDHRPIVMYVGNLEHYQGVDLLVESFASIRTESGAAELVIIGGEASDIQCYREKCARLGIAGRVRFLGPRPVTELAGWLDQADILVSPRIKGKNTPMKVFSYMHSGKPLLATRIISHTQVLNERVAMLGDPEPGPFSTAMLRLIQDPGLRARLGRAGREYVEAHFCFDSARKKIRELYGWLEKDLRSGPAGAHDAA